MSLWFDLNLTAGRGHHVVIGQVEIRRVEWLDLTDQAAIADVVSTYDVHHDGQHIGQVRHRYGDGKWPLVAKAANLIAQEGA